MALVTALASHVGIPPVLAWACMAEHRSADEGAWRPSASVARLSRTFHFVNAFSANGLNAFASTWERAGMDTCSVTDDLARMVIFIINTRGDRRHRSRHFARYLVAGSIAADYLVTGTDVPWFLSEIKRQLRRELKGVASRLRQALQTQDSRAAHTCVDAHLRRARLSPPDPAQVLARLRSMCAAVGLSHDLSACEFLRQDLVSIFSQPMGIYVTFEGSLKRLRQEGLPHKIACCLGVARGGPMTGRVVHGEPQPDSAQVVDAVMAMVARMRLHCSASALLGELLSGSPGRKFNGDLRGLMALLEGAFTACFRPMRRPFTDTADLLGVCTTIAPPGAHVTLVGALNIEGLGLVCAEDWNHWTEIERAGRALRAADGATQPEAVMRLEGLLRVDDPVGAAMAVEALQAVGGVFSPTMAALQERATALMSVDCGEGAEGVWFRVSRAMSALRGFSGQWLEGLRRGRQHRQVMDDLVHERISHTRAAHLLKRLCP